MDLGMFGHIALRIEVFRLETVPEHRRENKVERPLYTRNRSWITLHADFR